MPELVVERTRSARPTERRGVRDARGGGLSYVTAMVVRYGWAWVCVVGVVGAAVPVLASRGAAWRGDVLWTVDWLSVAFVMTGPIVAGFVAVDTARLSVGSGHLGARGWRQPANGLAVGYALVMSVVHLLLVAGALVVSAPPRFDRWTWLAVLVQLAMVWLFVGVGSVAGRLAGPLLGGAVAALVALVGVFTLSVPAGHVALLDGGAATVPRIGYTYSPVYLVVQLVALLLVIGAMTLVPARAGGGLRVMTPGARVVAVVLAVASVVMLFVGPAKRLSAVDLRPTLCDDVAGVRVCFYPEHRRFVGAHERVLAQMFEAARAAGYGVLVPDRVEEASRTRDPTGPGVGALFLDPEELADRPPSSWRLALDFVQPIYCDAVRQDVPPREEYWQDVHALAGTWAELTDPGIAEANGASPRTLSTEEAGDLVAQFQTCSYPFL